MYVSLCLITKDENSYIQEWLDYHILLGVEHFWIYDNDSTIPLEKTLKAYIEKGWVTLNQIHGKGMQLFAYDHCLQTYGSFSRWIGFIDTDEFIVPKGTNRFADFLRLYEKYAGLAINCLFFGSNDQEIRPKCGQIAGYLKRTPKEFTRNRLIKSIVQPDRVLFPISPHNFLFSEGNYCVNELESRVDGQFFPVHISKIQLNHYFTRSKQEMDEKKKRGRGDGFDTYLENQVEEINSNSSVFDPSALSLIMNILQLPAAIARNTEELIDPLSNNILGEIIKTAHQYEPPECLAQGDKTVGKREEFEKIVLAHKTSTEFISQGNFQAARDIYLGLIRQFPFEVMHYINLAAVCINLHELPVVWEALSKAWQISPRNWVILKCMMQYFYLMNNFEQMEKCCYLMNDIGDLEPLYLAGLSVAQWNLQKYDLALVNANKIWPLLTPDRIKEHIWFQEAVNYIQQAKAQNDGQK